MSEGAYVLGVSFGVDGFLDQREHLFWEHCLAIGILMSLTCGKPKMKNNEKIAQLQNDCSCQLQTCL